MSVGPLQLILILVIIFIIFGAGKLPRVMGDVGKGVRSLRKGLKGEEDTSAEVPDPLKELSSQAGTTESQVVKADDEQQVEK